MKMLKNLCIALLLNLALAAGSFAATHTPEQAKSLVQKALAYIKENGADQAYKAFNTPGGQFIDGDLYVFVVKFDYTFLAHGGNPKLIGKNLSDMQSADGKFVVKELVAIAKDKGQGWLDYQWANPETRKVQAKTSFVQRVPGTDTLVGAGIYK